MRQAVKSEVKRCTTAKVGRKKIHPRQMLEKSRNAVFFRWFVCPVSRKVGLLKRRVRRQVLRGDLKNCTALWRNANFEVKMLKNWRLRSTFWSSDVEKMHAAVRKRKFGSENVKKLVVWDQFLELRCRKIARRCGEKHMWKWKCTKHVSFGALFEVLVPKNCTTLWRKAHYQAKMYKTPHGWSTFWSSDVEKLHAAVAKSTLSSQNVQNTSAADRFLKFWCRKIGQVLS